MVGVKAKGEAHPGASTTYKIDAILFFSFWLFKVNLVKVSDSDYNIKNFANERPVYTVIDQW